MDLPAELIQQITAMAGNHSERRVLRYHRFVVSKEYMWHAEHFCKTVGKFKFSSNDFEQNQPKLDLQLFAKHLGHTVTSLVYTADAFPSRLSLEHALRTLLALFPNATKIKILDATRETLHIRRHEVAVQSRGMRSNLSRTATWGEIMHDFLSSGSLPWNAQRFTWILPIVENSAFTHKGNIKKFSLKWRDGQEEKNDLRWSHGGRSSRNTDITPMVAILVNLSLRPRVKIDDEELHTMRHTPMQVSDDSLWKLANSAIASLAAAEIADFEQYKAMMKKLRLARDSEYEARHDDDDDDDEEEEGDGEEDEVDQRSFEHWAVLELLDDLFIIRPRP